MLQDRSIDLRIVEGAKGISEFGDDWDDLFVRAKGASPFLSRFWIRTFVEEGRLPGTPLFILAWFGTKLVALFPLVVRRVLNTKTAMPIDAGKGAYLGLLIDPEHRSAIKDIADLIISGNIFEMYYSADLSSEDTATNDLLDDLVSRGYSCRKVFRDPCFCMQLGCSFDEYLKKKIPKGKRRRKLLYKEKRLYKSADVRVTRYVGKEITPELNRRVAAIQLESWMKRRGAAVLGEPFYQKLLGNMAEGGFGQVWLMTIDGEDAAFVYSFVAHGQHHYFWPAFKLKYESPLSIGQMLLMHVVRDACEDGIQLFDFNYGDAEYKRFWATDCYKVFRVVAGRGFMGHLIVMFCYVFFWLGQIKWLHSFYRWIRKRLSRFKQRTA
ncbi:MAG TPA: GNAT family N-acetyltransferase [Sedimentisphaerales bacterium]|nr:GNAT family N-acetyltransferase [Sedimentisphaerales bacterium]